MHTYSLMQKSGKLYHNMQSKSIQRPADSDEEHEQAKEDGLVGRVDEEAPLPTSVKPREHEHGEEEEHQMVSNFTAQSTASSAAMHGHSGILGETDSPELHEAPLLSCESEVADMGFWTKLKDTIHQFIEELMAPPTISVVCFGISLLTSLWHIVGIGRTKSDVDATSWIR
jgi:auxin efflux carrier family protein